jgi:hypothetical protein
MSTSRLDVLIWVLIYGGLLSVALGLSVQRSEGGLGIAVIIIGAIAAAVGVLLVYVRSRMKQDTSPP